MEKLKQFCYNKKYTIISAIAIFIIAIFLCFWITQKQGFHEDEIFSYGSSNYKWDSMFQLVGKSDYTNTAIEKYIIADSFSDTLKNIKYYLQNPQELEELKQQVRDQEKTVWKTKEDAKEYVTIGNGDVFNYLSVYYNQSRDVHPPLFYFLVHFVSSIAYGSFSKYIIFAINLVFMLLTCNLIRKIFELFGKKTLGIIAMLLYGFSMGAVTTAIFLRMYAMLTFFTIAYLYINLKIWKNDFEISKTEKWKLFFTTVLGFLTQYYFCIFALFTFIIMCIYMIKKKKYKILRTYIGIHILSAIVGIIIFPASIYHIFFSYRGAGAEDSGKGIIEMLGFYITRMQEAFSIQNFTTYGIVALVAFGFILKCAKKIKEKSLKDIFPYILIAIPTILYFIVVAKIAPTNVGEKPAIRYIMNILPQVVILFVLAITFIFKEKKIAYAISILITILISVNGIIYNKPSYLYQGYNEYTEIAEKYHELPFVYTVDNSFTHINSMPEYLIYDKTLILDMSYVNIEFLKQDEVIQNTDKFILSIKKWTNVEDILQKILDNTGFNHFEVLYDKQDDTQSIIYLISKI